MCAHFTFWITWLISIKLCMNTIPWKPLTGRNTLRRHLYIMELSNNPICRKWGTEEETSVHILCECEALVSLRHTNPGSFFLDLEDIRELALVDIQLDAQNSYLFTYNTFIKILYMFRALPRTSSGGLRRNCIHATSGIIILCRWLSCAPVKKEQFFLNWCIRQSPAESDDTRGCIYTITM